MSTVETGSATPAGNPEGANPAPTGAETPAAQQSASWFDGFQNEDLKGWAGNKKFATPEIAMESYRNLEKMFGAERAGRTVVRPAENADPAELEAFYNQLGRPDSPEKYKWEVRDNDDPQFTEWFRNTAHKHGLTAQQAAALKADYDKFYDGMEGQLSEQSEAAFAKSQEALRKEWGAAYDANLQSAKIAAREFGVTGDMIDALEKAAGYDGVMKLFANIGSRIGEKPGFAGAQSGNGDAPLTPAQAQDKIAQALSDPNWRNAYQSGSQTHIDQMNRWQQAANAR